MKRILFLLLFLTACGGATETWPDGYPEPTPEPEERAFVVPQPEPMASKYFSVIEGQPVTFMIDGEEHTMELYEVTQNRSRMRVDNVSFMMNINQSATRSGIRITIEEAVQRAVPVPRQSVVDMSVAGVRSRLFAGQTITIGNASATVDFVGLQGGVPHTRVVVGKQSAILAEKEEHRFDEFWVYVHNIYFNDATEYYMADAITVRVK